jgi:hypothetical protein
MVIISLEAQPDLFNCEKCNLTKGSIINVSRSIKNLLKFFNGLILVHFNEMDYKQEI